jgi:PAS domain S-box-containing protein
MKKEKKRSKQEPKRPRQNRSSRQRRGLRATLVEASPDALIALDAEGTILYWSAGAEAVYGFAKGEALGLRLQNLVTPPEFVAEGEQIIRDAIEHGLAVHEAVHRKKDGSAIYVDITAKTVRDKTGNIEFVAVSHKDVTQLKVLNHGKILDSRNSGLLETVPDAIYMVNKT